MASNLRVLPFGVGAPSDSEDPEDFKSEYRKADHMLRTDPKAYFLGKGFVVNNKKFSPIKDIVKDIREYMLKLQTTSSTTGGSSARL